MKSTYYHAGGILNAVEQNGCVEMNFEGKKRFP
jgi:hypothetical protein